MWNIMQDGNAINNNTGEEMYMDYGSDAIVRVYLNNKAINMFTSVVEARDFIKERTDWLNKAENYLNF